MWGSASRLLLLNGTNEESDGVGSHVLWEPSDEPCPVRVEDVFLVGSARG